MIINELNLKKKCDHNELHIKKMLAKRKKYIKFNSRQFKDKWWN
jgi:hypothetical protein